MSGGRRGTPGGAADRPPDYRVVILGSGGVGKTALAQQFVHARFVDHYDPTFEESYRKQSVIDEQNTDMEILEIAGQVGYSAIGDSSLQRGDGFLLIFAIDSRSSFQELRQLQQQILRVKNENFYPMLLVGNKSDLDAERRVAIAEAKELAQEFGCRYVETSAKLRHNVEESFHGLIREIRQYRTTRQKKKRDNVKGTGKRSSQCIML